MRKFKTTPQKKFLGMLILFVFLPLFLLWYWVFPLDHKPGDDTIVIIAAVALLTVYLYWKYKKQIDALAAGSAPPEGPVEGEALDEESDEDEKLPKEDGLPEDSKEESDEKLNKGSEGELDAAEKELDESLEGLGELEDDLDEPKKQK